MSAVEDFIEEAGLFYERLGLSRTAGRVVGHLLVSDDDGADAPDLCEHLAVAKSSVSVALRQLDRAGMVERFRRRGERRDRYRLTEDVFGRAFRAKMAEFDAFQELGGTRPRRGGRGPVPAQAAGEHARHVRLHGGAVPRAPGRVGGLAMKVLLVTMGSRGDIEPFAALGVELARAGHEAVLAAPRRLTADAAARGVPVAPLDDGIFTLQEEVAGKGARASFTAVRSALPLLRRWLDDLATLRDSDADVVVYAPKSLGATHLADRLGVPSIAALPVPLFTPTSRFPSPLSPVRPPRRLNRASWRLAAAVEAPYRRMVRSWRSEALGLTGPTPNLTERVARDGVLHAWSPHLLPAPDDWPADLAPTGFWNLPHGGTWTPPEGLTRFLDAGEPPVYVGFGSMLARDPDAFTRTVLDALHRSGRRAVLATGWGALRPSSVPETVHVLDQAPHSWLLPRTAVVVHHGGVGTVGAALRAGVPQVIRPFLGDQPFWARRVARDRDRGGAADREVHCGPVRDGDRGRGVQGGRGAFGRRGGE